MAYIQPEKNYKIVILPHSYGYKHQSVQNHIKSQCFKYVKRTAVENNLVSLFQVSSPSLNS